MIFIQFSRCYIMDFETKQIVDDEELKKYDKYDNIDICMIPVRCFTCGKVLPNVLSIIDMKKKGVSNFDIFNKMKLDRYCCRRMFSCVFD